jgi:hypothetical protein
MIGASPDSLKILVLKSFLVQLSDDVYRISHWEINNYLRPDRFSPSMYQHLKQTEGYLALKNGDLTGRSDELYQRYTRSHTLGIPKERVRKKEVLAITEPKNQKVEESGKNEETESVDMEKIEQEKEKIRETMIQIKYQPQPEKSEVPI